VAGWHSERNRGVSRPDGAGGAPLCPGKILRPRWGRRSLGGHRGRSQSRAAARLIFSAPSGSPNGSTLVGKDPAGTAWESACNMIGKGRLDAWACGRSPAGSASYLRAIASTGPAGPPIVSRSASEPRERRHRSFQKQPPAPLGAQDRPAVRAPWLSGPLRKRERPLSPSETFDDLGY